MGVREKREARRQARAEMREQFVADQIAAAEETGCDLCIHAVKHGHWGDPRITHCKRCHTTWNRETNIAHCTVCCRTFSTPANFDRHRKEGECLDPESVGLETKVDKHGTVIWKRPGPSKDVWT